MSGEKSSPTAAGVPLQKVVEELTAYAPLALAEPWDNVGLLIEPYTARNVTSIMLTNDLTKPVMDECLDKNIDMIISYHPPIFVGKKKITNKNWQDQLISCCLENRIAVYSPHTSWDSVRGGVTDWLASAFADSPLESKIVLEPHSSYPSPEDHEYSVLVTGSSSRSDETGEFLVRKYLEDIGFNVTSIFATGGINCFQCIGTCDKKSLTDVRGYVSSLEDVSCEIYNRVPLPVANTGGGRLLRFEKPITIATAIDNLKSHLGVKQARIAYAVGANRDTLIRSVALVPGSGAKPLAGVRADLYVTGEMLHHDVLAATHKNTSVLMTTHSDSERGFLTHFSKKLDKRLGGQVAITVSVMDRDPIQIV